MAYLKTRLFRFGFEETPSLVANPLFHQNLDLVSVVLGL